MTMSAFPDPLSTPRLRCSIDLTRDTPVETTETMKTRELIDLPMSSDDEIEQSSRKKIMLIDPRFTEDTKEDVSPARTLDGITAEDRAPINTECLVATPPATSPPPNAPEDAPDGIVDGTTSSNTNPTTSVSDFDSAGDETPLPLASSSSVSTESWDASQYPVFNPDDALEFEYYSTDLDIFTEPSAFKDHIIELAYLERNDRKFRHNLQDCLRGSARTWYYEELTQRERQELCHGFLEDWLSALISRFHRDFDEYAQKIEADPWNLECLREGRSLEEWVETQFTHAQAIFEYDYESLHFIWEQIDPVLREDVPEPSNSASWRGYGGFLEGLERAEMIWRKVLDLEPREWRSDWSTVSS